MRTISEAVETVIEGNAFLRFGLYHRLLNLSQVARFLQPLVEARCRKPVRPSAILMSLSRLQKRLHARPPAAAPPTFYIDRINVHAGLCSITFAKEAETHQAMNRLFNRIQAEEGYITYTEGNTEITAIIEERHLPLARATVPAAPRQVARRIAGLGIQFAAAYTEAPGLLYGILQQLALLNINVVEVASTMTEFNVYLDEADLMTAFDALLNRFSRDRAGRDPIP
ncbi:hypothetical protein GQ464_004645 [Rhodocaloribacter litoris]|uniref:hypothetical protein n=1 Tax=Rhodocaloribacter litoris TaxID=2558931 RepID=UPI00141DC12C|nr:hypothetical protein [Rhodocaloribacter litoris]QXD16247.1 hypothetical protein GQ464_004645 [Rhodocaloribacter litoris]